MTKFAGKWYQLFRLPNRLEEGLEEITVHYELTDNNRTITIINEGRLIEDKSKIKQAKGKIWMPNPAEPSKFKISYYWYSSNDYWIFKVDTDYSHALVGDPNGKSLWILSRERAPDLRMVSYLLEYASSLGFSVESLISSLAD